MEVIKLWFFPRKKKEKYRLRNFELWFNTNLSKVKNHESDNISSEIENFDSKSLNFKMSNPKVWISIHKVKIFNSKVSILILKLWILIPKVQILTIHLWIFLPKC